MDFEDENHSASIATDRDSDTTVREYERWSEEKKLIESGNFLILSDSKLRALMEKHRDFALMEKHRDVQMKHG